MAGETAIISCLLINFESINGFVTNFNMFYYQNQFSKFKTFWKVVALKSFTFYRGNNRDEACFSGALYFYSLQLSWEKSSAKAVFHGASQNFSEQLLTRKRVVRKKIDPCQWIYFYSIKEGKDSLSGNM